MWVYYGTWRAQLHRRVELPEFMSLTKKEHNDLVAERKKNGLNTRQFFTPIEVGRGRGESQMGLQSRARVLHTLPWALIPIRAEFPILSGLCSRCFPGCVPDVIRAAGGKRPEGVRPARGAGRGRAADTADSLVSPLGVDFATPEHKVSSTDAKRQCTGEQ